MVITSKRGQLDNVITYEHICDFTADIADIDPHYITLGSVCTVINGEGGLELYIADSEKQWHPIMAGSGESGNNDNEQGSGSSSSEGPFGLREIARFSGNDVELTNDKNDTNIHISNYQGGNEQNDAICRNIKAIGVFATDSSVPTIMSSTYNMSFDDDDGTTYMNGHYNIIAATFNQNSIDVATIGGGNAFNTYDSTISYEVVFYGE